MEKYVIGVDGGGTKTEAVIVDRLGTIVARIKGGSTNYQALGGEKLRQELMALFDRIVEVTKVTTDRVTHVFLGLAGAGRQSDQQEIKTLFKDTAFKDRITVDTDAIIALAGAFGNRPGIILIAGTGAICFGKNKQGKVIRSGGWGYLLGDEGGGYYIGRSAIIAALKDFDGRGSKTALMKVIESKFNLSAIDEIIPLIYKNQIDRIAIAQLAPVVFEQAKKGDSMAQLIIRQAGNELGQLAKAVAVRLDLTNDKVKVALIGSIFKQRDMLVNEITKELFELSWDIEIKEPEFEPVVGAAILAMEKSAAPIDNNILVNLKKPAGIYL